MSETFWDTADKITSLFVHLSVLAAAIFATVKFRLLRTLGRRYQSELQCKHYSLDRNKSIFVGEYSVYNTGERPIALTRVTLRLHPAIREGAFLIPNEQTLLVENVVDHTDHEQRGLVNIEWTSQTEGKRRPT